MCDGCLLLHRCPYPYIFETPPALHLPEVLQKRFRQAPRPYIFEVPLSYRGEETLELGLVLVGRALDFLLYAPLALSLGILVQLLWEEKTVTQPL